MTDRTRSVTRSLLPLAGAVILTAAGTGGALACRGTAEYPEVAAKLAAAHLSADRKADLTRRLEEGRALHDEAHRKNDTREMEKSLEILDRVKGAM